MKKSLGIRLTLNRETLRTLASPELGLAAGDGTGGGIQTIYISCGGSCTPCVTQTNCFSICMQNCTTTC